jgi:hypothetical protein
VGRDARDEEPKGFLDEVFEHRQRRPEPADPPSTADETVESTVELSEVAPVADAGDSGVAPDETAEAGEAPQSVVHALDPHERALIDEAMKKSGIVWVHSSTAHSAQAAWYVWLDGAAYVLTGVGEQPDPRLGDASAARVSARSKETRSLLVEWVGAPSRVLPTDADWEQIATALAKARLNLPDPATAPDRWAADPAIAIYRIAPTGPLIETPGSYSDASGRAVPVSTPATTAGPPPKVIHRRQTARRPLS